MLHQGFNLDAPEQGQVLRRGVLLKFPRTWLMISAAIASNCDSDTFSNAHVIEHFWLACWSVFLKNTPKYINGSKPLNKKGQPPTAFNQTQSLSTLEM